MITSNDQQSLNSHTFYSRSVLYINKKREKEYKEQHNNNYFLCIINFCRGWGRFHGNICY